MRLHHSLRVPNCLGIDHMDFTADGRFLLASCEFAGRMIVVDVHKERLVRTVVLRRGAAPPDVKLAPDGRTFYVADMIPNGVWLLAGLTFKKLRFGPPGPCAHGLYASRDS